MNNKPLIIVAGEPFSIFSEIFLKSIRKKIYKKPIILIISKDLFIKQTKKLNVKFTINLIDQKNFKINKLSKTKINIINVNFKFKKVFDKISIDTNKTSDFVSFLKKLKLNDKKVTILVSDFQENLILSSRNLRNVYVENVKNVSVYDLLDSEIIVTDKQGLSDLIKVLA